MIKYKMMINDEKNTIIVVFGEEPYTDVVVKIGNIAHNEKNEVEFEMELPETMAHYYKDENFTNLVAEVVGDIVRKAIRQAWNDNVQEVLSDLEARLLEAFKTYKYKPKEGESFVSMFAKKGYVVSVETDTEKLIATNLRSKKVYYFDNPKQLAYLKKQISGSGIIFKIIVDK